MEGIVEYLEAQPANMIIAFKCRRHICASVKINFLIIRIIRAKVRTLMNTRKLVINLKYEGKLSFR